MMRKTFFITILVTITAIFLPGTLFLAKKPELGRLADLSKVIRSESGEIINLRLTPSGHWREPADIKRIDPLLISMLVAYEDQRFWDLLYLLVPRPRF